MQSHSAVVERPVSLVAQVKASAKSITPENFATPIQMRITELQEGPEGLHGLGVAGINLPKRQSALLRLAEELDSPLETVARDQVLKEVEEVVGQIHNLKNTRSRIETNIAAEVAQMTRGALLSAKYPLIEFDSVPWITASGIALVPLHVQGKNCTFQARDYGSDMIWEGVIQKGNKSAHEFRERLHCLFLPALKQMHSDHVNRGGRSSDTMERVYAYQGVIPKSAKEKMKAAQPDFAPDGFLLMIADAALLDVKTKVIPDPDPLIVGYDPACPDYLWLVDAFDMSPIEQHLNDKALARFASQPSGG